MRKTNANSDTTTVENIELDTKVDVSDIVELKWNQMAEFTWDWVLNNIEKFTLNFSFYVGNTLVVAVNEVVAYDSACEWVKMG